MSVKTIKSFLSILNSDALLFLGTRLAGITLSITSIVLLCRAVTLQQHFDTNGQGHLYDLLPLGPLVYSLVWSIASLILPGCQRKYHPALDMGFDFAGWVMSFATGAALLKWSVIDGYEFESCHPPGASGKTTPTQVEPICIEIENSIRGAERSGAVLLLLAGVTHLIMFIRASLAVHARRKKYVPSRNSWMQLEKGADRTPSLVTLELNVTNYIEAEQRREEAARQKIHPEGRSAEVV